VNIQFLTDTRGRLLWASPVLPGSTHDLTMARAHGIITALTGQAIACLADKVCIGTSGAIGTLHRKPKGRKLEQAQETVQPAPP
jgi:hypothetical protein